MVVQVLKQMMYQAFGFTISSAMKLPELIQIEQSSSPLDIVIQYEHLIDEWNQTLDKEKGYSIRGNRVLFEIEEVAVFAVEAGKTISISPLLGSDEDEIRLYVLGTCMGIILMQHHLFPFHGSAIVLDGEAYAIVGESGAGKSTLASAFMGQGFKLLSDDVIPICFTGDRPMVIPSYPSQKLWQESLDHFGMKSSDFQPLYGRETKFSVPVREGFLQKSVPLAGVIELLPVDESAVSITPVKGLERLHTLYRHTYRNLFLKPLGLMDWHFARSVELSNQLAIYQLKRPISTFSVHDLVEKITYITGKGRKE